MAIDYVKEIKTRAGITGNYHDELIAAYVDDVKSYMADAGVDENTINETGAIGTIARGVVDIWNLGSWDGEFSGYFKERVIQLSTRRRQE